MKREQKPKPGEKIEPANFGPDWEKLIKARYTVNRAPNRISHHAHHFPQHQKKRGLLARLFGGGR